ncbi:MAG: fumarylacetoacetate hydrolase family protein [Candidatus Latescibacterota bacterium]|nr:MAG: fumarylacetoacetate hydrolase family protein [Candidatus Latescibacterota bacterium]
MKIVSFGPKGQERPGIVHGDRLIDLVAADSLIPASVRRILEGDLVSRLASIVQNVNSLPSKCFKRPDGVRLGPPVTDPSKIICIGLNYSDHAAEQGKQVPDWPLTFAKGPNALIGDGDAIPIPPGVTQLDHEVELAVVIGRRAKAVSLDDAPKHVAGYSVFMDITARDVQFREKQWFRSKSFDGFGPFGPYLTTSDEVPDPHNLRISLEVNGQTYQSSNTGFMTFKVFYLVHYLSHSMTLEPGDVIATGTPAGVGAFAAPQRFLSKGDTVKATIESLGTLTNPVV